MKKPFALLTIVMCLSFAAAQAQTGDDLPAPPKPPKALRDKIPPEAKEPAPEKVPPGKLAPRREGDRSRDGARRPVRVRVIAPFVRVHVNANEDERANGVAPLDIDVNAAGGGVVVGDHDSRYRWHNGQWWYFMPDRRWMVWQDGGWVEVPEETRPPREMRFGTPNRGGVRIKIGDLPELNLGF